MRLNHINNHIPSTIFDQSCSGPCIVIGSGPSQESLITNKDWKNYYTISANWSQIHFPSQLYFWQDASFIASAKKQLVKKQYISCSVLPTSKSALNNDNLMQDIGGMYINRIPTQEKPPWIETKKSNSLKCCSPISGAVAMCMAYILGFDPIILVGFDCNEGEYTYLKKHPQFGYFNKRGANVHAQTQVRLLKNLEKEINIINCSRTEAITRYDFGHTIKALGQSNKSINQSKIKDI